MSARLKLHALAVLAALTASVPAGAQCSGDIVPDGRVDGGDLGTLLANWGPVTASAVSRACDLDSNGQINGADLGALLADWGQCPILVPAWATLIQGQPDPAIVTDPALRSAIVASGRAWRVRDNATQIEFVLIPAGSFDMGCSASPSGPCMSNEYPRHAVILTGAFYLARFEVTQAQWTAVVGSNASAFRNASTEVPAAQVGNRPVESVSWSAVQGFLSLTAMRLPTEAEWEFAYRAGTATAFHGFPGFVDGTNSDSLLSNIAWYSQGDCSIGAQCQTRPVGGKPGNGLGLHDMSGNVGEWVADWFGDYPTGPQTDPTGPATGSSRVARGGGWNSSSPFCRASSRNFAPTSAAYDSIGFRVARNP